MMSISPSSGHFFMSTGSIQIAGQVPARAGQLRADFVEAVGPAGAVRDDPAPTCNSARPSPGSCRVERFAPRLDGQQPLRDAQCSRPAGRIILQLAVEPALLVEARCRSATCVRSSALPSNSSLQTSRASAGRSTGPSIGRVGHREGDRAASDKNSAKGIDALRSWNGRALIAVPRAARRAPKRRTAR